MSVCQCYSQQHHLPQFPLLGMHVEALSEFVYILLSCGIKAFTESVLAIKKALPRNNFRWPFIINIQQFSYTRPIYYRVRGLVFNATFNNISVISWRSVLVVEETGVSGKNHRPTASHWQTLSLLYITEPYIIWSSYSNHTGVNKVLQKVFTTPCCYFRDNLSLYSTANDTWPFLVTLTGEDSPIYIYIWKSIHKLILEE